MSDLRIPIPDPLGLLETATKDSPVQLFDPILGTKEIKKPVIPTGDGVDVYKYHLSAALKTAPCPGCKKLVTGALVGVEIFERMEKAGVDVKDISQDDINEIKRMVKEKYGE